ncbi:MAG TPA: hypothetical protein VNS12_06375 [Pelagibacterium sp.]|uniref:hypothetical protein n=1 Tax=Pelagibacterium sp. TaxID=1967288 RepID=UPI002C9002FA|nr:hypothetical protein [Pelagibacterium sp.]HWJ87677.1 hypothetical protein [Pelagibacterium sp.]
MAEFEYRGFRFRTVFEDDWRIRIWPPLRPIGLIDRVRASREEGERICYRRATAAIDAFIDRPVLKPGRRAPVRTPHPRPGISEVNTASPS